MTSSAFTASTPGLVMPSVVLANRFEVQVKFSGPSRRSTMRPEVWSTMLFATVESFGGKVVGWPPTVPERPTTRVLLQFTKVLNATCALLT